MIRQNLKPYLYLHYIKYNLGEITMGRYYGNRRQFRERLRCDSDYGTVLKIAYIRTQINKKRKWEPIGLYCPNHEKLFPLEWEFINRLNYMFRKWNGWKWESRFRNMIKRYFWMKDYRSRNPKPQY